MFRATATRKGFCRPALFKFILAPSQTAVHLTRLSLRQVSTTMPPRDMPETIGRNVDVVEMVWHRLRLTRASA